MPCSTINLFTIKKNITDFFDVFYGFNFKKIQYYLPFFQSSWSHPKILERTGITLFSLFSKQISFSVIGQNY